MRLTLTWDVLKYKSVAEKHSGVTINFNMGCFEMKRTKLTIVLYDRLTLTWDVLKS